MHDGVVYKWNSNSLLHSDTNTIRTMKLLILSVVLVFTLAAQAKQVIISFSCSCKLYIAVLERITSCFILNYSYYIATNKSNKVWFYAWLSSWADSG